MTEENKNKTWADKALDFTKEISMPITNQSDDLFRTYLKDTVIISGVFMTILGTFLIKPKFNNYPCLLKIGFLFSFVTFVSIIIASVFCLNKSVKELIPGAIYAHKVSVLLNEMSYFESLFSQGKISQINFKKREQEFLTNLKKMQGTDRFSKEKINDIGKTEKKIHRILNFVVIAFLVGIILFVLSLVFVLLNT